MCAEITSKVGVAQNFARGVVLSTPVNPGSAPGHVRNGMRMPAYAQTVYKDGVLSSSVSPVLPFFYIHTCTLTPQPFPSWRNFGHLYLLFNLIARFILELEVSN